MKLIFKGIVQGVGFRPTVYRIAKKLDLKGYVLNKGSEVEVVIDKNKKEFIENLKQNLPEIAEIKQINEKPDDTNFSEYTDFEIIHSENGERQSLIPVDTATCDNCLQEIFDPENRRHLYPFTNCTVCGARYSLIEDVPYDRERTSMKQFPLCKECEKEYEKPLNRRYHAQTISCPKCGPHYQLFNKDRGEIKDKNILQFFAEKIDQGKIGVIKSWGGMHLCCKTENIEQFRSWYNRPQKPFAVMVKNIETAEKYAKLSSYEKKLLSSKSRPILLLEKKKEIGVSPGLNTIGLFLPYTGLHHILFSYLDVSTLIMTSANIPGEPMIISNEKAFSLKADFYLLHNRDIPNRIDDSVIKTWKEETFFIRKARGFIPKPIDVDYNRRIVSVGAGENVTGSVATNRSLYTTQYIGKSKYYPTLDFLKESVQHIMDLTMNKHTVDAVAMDLHPKYETRYVAKKISEKYNAEVFEVQHHWAHAASLLLDNNKEEGVVLTLDGLGYGDDGTLWGGEVLNCNYNDFKRVGHLKCIPLLGGDQAAKDPRRLLFAIFKKIGEEKYFADKKAENLSKLMDKSPVSSSMGRFLDAVSCYLDVCKKRTYEGEPAMKLERYLSKGENKYKFDVKIKDNVVDTVDLFKQAEEKNPRKLSEKQKADLAYSMVKTVIDALTDIAIEEAKENNIKNVGVTGGVSYNIPIVDMIYKRVKDHELNMMTHHEIPNGDGGISIGQNIIIGNKIRK
ncbi:MAG: carbamoyltransferase HypF [Candidatus Thermoplasmatota archaeon]